MKKRNKRLLSMALAAMLMGGLPFSYTCTEAADRNAAQAQVKDPAPDADGFVARVHPVEPQQKLQMKDLRLPKTMKLVDAKATPATAGLAAFLHGVAKSPYVLYGHQNDVLHKSGQASKNPSDTYDDVGDYAAVAGVDFQALHHGDFELTPEEEKAGMTLTEKMARICEEGASHGIIFTAAAHMPNFNVIAKRGQDANGHWDFSGYSTPVTEGDVVARILPGGDLNACYRAYLDQMAALGQRLDKSNIPLIVRLFHEADGGWFWWGEGHCTPAQYKQLFRYTVHYLRDVKGVHNFLYAYSPGGPVTSEAAYRELYPGDAFVDLVGFDMYHRDVAKKDSFMQEMDASVKVLTDFAEKHGKIAALTETGLLGEKGALPKTGNVRKKWFSELEQVLEKHPVSYVLIWSNDNAQTYFEPFMVDKVRGHEMINEFIDFYNEPGTIFASQVPDYRAIQAHREGNSWVVDTEKE